MSDLLNSASLVMIPSGYKEDVVYSQIPTDGSGDLSFTRASNGTRVNSAGLIEVVPWNLTDYSEDFSNAFWGKLNATITSNAIVAPNGTTTADKFVENNGTGDKWVYYTPSIVVGEKYTYTVYAKKGERNFLYINAYSNGNNRTWFNLNTGAIGTSESGVATIQDVGNGWYRCTVSITAVSGTQFYLLGVSNADNVTSYTGNGTDGIYIWGAQLNIGSTAKPYFPTTDRLNVPRLTYQNGGGGCPSLLLEKQSTNLITYSEDINNSFSAKSGVTITSNNTISPDGTQNADLLKFDTTTAYILRGQTVNPLTTYTMSVFVKNNNFTSVELLTFNMSDGVIGGLSAQINVVAKTATFSAPPSAYTSVSGKVEDYGNGWFRVSVTGTSVNGGSGWYQFAASGVTNSCFIWGLSLEVSSYATSYIPTTSSSATRVADACYKTGISSLIGQTEGTLFVDFVWTKVGKTYQSILLNASSSYANCVYLLTVESSGIAKFQFYIGGITLISEITTTLTTGTRYKVALAYKSGSIAFYVNGVSVGTSAATYGAVSEAISQFRYDWPFGGDEQWCSPINQSAVFKTRLTNAELASLTTI